MRAVNAVLTGAIALAVTIGLSTGVGSQTLRTAKGPAETPPSSYKASSYVDSRGCMYIRAGYGGNVSWVPRVTRKRKQICGQKPTGGVRTTAKTTVKTPSPTTVATATSVTPPKAKRPKINWNWFGTPRRTKVKTPPVQTTVQPTVVVTAPKPKTRVATVAPSWPWTKRNAKIRTTPQAVHPADFYNGRLGRNGQEGQAVQVTRVQPYKLPKGYKSLLATEAPARRGVGTAQGQAQMDLLWTQTMLRRLIDVTTGRDMTAQLPQIKYPYTTVTASTRSFVPATAAPIRKKKSPADLASPLNMTELKVTGVEDVSALDPTVKSIVPKIKVKVETTVITKAAFRFVQVATFGVPANASRTIERFNTGGIPTVSRPLTRKGMTYAIVMLGPFKDDATLKAALASARGAGFSDAFFVK